MTLIIQKPTGAKLNLAQTYVGIDDPNAAVYIAAVEAADEAASPGVGALETATKVAIHSFVKGCKNDGTWPAIKASCILAGARTLNGALVPLAGTTPTNFNFVAGDYNRETGLIGDASTKYLNSGRADNTDPQDNAHAAIYVSAAGSKASAESYLGASNNTNSYREFLRAPSNNATFGYARSSSGQSGGSLNAVGFMGVSRSAGASFLYRRESSTATLSLASAAPSANSIAVFAERHTSTINYSNARLAFYSIGESLDLALLDARVTDLINAFAAAIP